MQFSFNAAQQAVMRNSVEAAKDSHRLPTHSRAAVERERQAVRDALAGVLGCLEAERLVGLAENLPPEDPLPPSPDNAWTRAQEMLETRAGRERLRTLRWEQI